MADAKIHQQLNVPDKPFTGKRSSVASESATNRSIKQGTTVRYWSALLVE